VARRNLAGQRAILTGASSGIGWHLALALAKCGCSLVINARRVERLQDLAKRIAGLKARAFVAAGDISDELVRNEIVASAVKNLGGVDILINCAGIGAVGPFSRAEPERLRRIFEVNFFSAAELIREALPALKQGTSPLIVNVGSVLGHRAVPNKSEYCASKFALHGFSDALRAELASDGVEVLLVSPSTTDSEFFENLIDDQTGGDCKGKRPMPPEKVASTIVRAMQTRKHEIILTHGGRGLVWLDRLFPTMTNRLVARYQR
jgi:short-subunit dehydrogenase